MHSTTSGSRSSISRSPKITPISGKYALLSILLMTACSSAPVQNGTMQSSASASAVSSSIKQVTDAEWLSPLSRADERITKKPFGILINPKTSPVQPEKFSGYHSGTDFEILPGEEDADVTVTAICSGGMLTAKWVSGYGGVLVQWCEYNGEPVTVLYGHLNIDSVIPRQDNIITAGDTIGVLGKGYSKETDNERKHLHLSVHKGKAVELKGYVQTEATLDQWINLYQ